MIKKVHFKAYKAMADFELDVLSMNVFTGSNNAGKSTILSAFRVLDVAISYARHRSSRFVNISGISRRAYDIPVDNLHISLENIHTDLEEQDTEVHFIFEDESSLNLFFPKDGGCLFYADQCKIPTTPTTFKRYFPVQVVQVPVLGPLEHNEPYVTDQTVKKGRGTHRASRHFRNHWFREQEGFDKFRELIEKTWPSMTVERPELNKGTELHMFCREDNITRELYWCGFGFQIWCQLLTHISRANPGDILVVDEPETYLHPLVQKQLLQILRDTKAQVMLATHSPTLIASAQKGEVVAVSRKRKKAKRFEIHGIKLCQAFGLLPN